MKGTCKSLVLIICVLYIIFFPINKLVAQTDQSVKELELSLSAKKVFFNLENIKPGDYATKKLTVSNNGKQNFSYLFSNQFLSGSEKLYEELLLTIKANTTVLFNGKLQDFDKLEPRMLNSGDSENLSIRVEVPFELGNTYQELGSEFQFKFYVEGTLGGVLPVDNRLPDTATNMFNYLILGVALTAGGGAMYIYQRRRKLNSKKEY